MGMTDRLPALFIGHGSPMTMITDNPERRGTIALGQRLPHPKAILCISAHWQTQGKVHVTAAAQPRTIHDFSGFPDELYQISYPAPSSPWLVDRVAELLGEERVVRDNDWGFDHGTYGVVMPLFDDATIPPVEMSLARSLTMAQHLELGVALAPLRDEGVLIIGSGNIVHNLAMWRQTMGTQPAWALEFQQRINAALVAQDLAALTSFADDDEAARLAINSAEHYLPMLYAAGARLPGDSVGVLNDSINGSLSMTSYVIGDAGLVRGIA